MTTHRYRIHIEPMSHDAQAVSHFEQFAFEIALQTDLCRCVSAAHAQGLVQEDHAAASYGVALPLLTEVLIRRPSDPLFAALAEQLRHLVGRLPDTNGFLSEVFFPEELEKRVEGAMNEGPVKGNRSFNEKA